MIQKDVKLTFLGTGTSQGVPVIACSCKVCQSKNSKDKRLRSSVMFTIDDINIVVDTGPDFRQQMLRENVQNVHAVLFTHAHKDHTAGLDDVRSFNFKHQKNMPIYCEKNVLDQLKQEFHYIFNDKYNYPGIPKISPQIITNQKFEIDGIEIIPIRGLHYSLPVLGYRIGDIAYITDVNQILDEEIEKLKDLKVFIINALRKETHVSHFNLQQALEMIEKLKPEQAYLTHLSHHMGSHNEVLRELPENIFLSYDGLKV